MKTLEVLAIAEVIALAVSKLLRFDASIVYTIVGMMIVTFGYILENALAEKGKFPHRRKLIVVILFLVVVFVYWMLNIV